MGANVTLTNPGGLGTVASVPRLMSGQGTIVATGSIAYPRPRRRRREDRAEKVMTMTSTYDHRVIQGAESGPPAGLWRSASRASDDFYEGVRLARGAAWAGSHAARAGGRGRRRRLGDAPGEHRQR